MQFFKESNGHKMTITVDVETLLQEIDDLKNDEEYLEYYNQLVSGDCSCDMVDKDAILSNLDEFAELVTYYGENGEELFNGMAYKKNGTFSLRVKPVVKQAVNGAYWEDSYGWNTKVLRLEPTDDTHAEVVLTSIIVHY